MAVNPNCMIMQMGEWSYWILIGICAVLICECVVQVWMYNPSGNDWMFEWDNIFPFGSFIMSAICINFQLGWLMNVLVVGSQVVCVRCCMMRYLWEKVWSYVCLRVFVKLVSNLEEWWLWACIVREWMWIPIPYDWLLC